MESDIGVTLEDRNDDEDLLEYDESGEISNDENGVVNVLSEDEVRKAAEALLQKESPKVMVHFKDDSFFLFDYNNEEENNEDDEVTPIIVDNSKLIHNTCNQLFVSMRNFLENYYGRLAFMSKEILLEIPSLDIVLCEDNVYNNQITFNDIHTIFTILKERSDLKMEEEVPNFLEAFLNTRSRFVSRYNALVELTQSNATFKNIRPFVNDETHPLDLEDAAYATDDKSVVMNIDEETEPASKERQQSPSVERASEELLEIVDN